MIEKNYDKDKQVSRSDKKECILHIDGSSNVDGPGTGLILTSPTGEDVTYALWFEFCASNKESEYEELITGLKLAIRNGCENIRSFVDSMVATNQTNGIYESKVETWCNT